VRFPDGVGSQTFYEKRAPRHTPDWVRTAPITMGSEGELDFIVCDDLPTLTWLAQLAALELHPSLSREEGFECPTVLAFDLDPGPPADITDCAEVALTIRAMFERFELECFPKTSGSKGMQVYLPLNSAQATYEETKPFAHTVAEALERSEPKRVVSKMKKTLRKGKVFVDWSQNDRAKTTVAAYSLRARDRPWISTPLTWDEVEGLVDGDADSVRFEAEDVLARVEDHGDLFAPVLEREQVLPQPDELG
jgi:bifunctional non-homologous end joining protein LigD